MAAGEAIAVSSGAMSGSAVVANELLPACPAAWRGVLEAAGGHFDGPAVASYGEVDIEPVKACAADVVADLSHFGLIAVDGPDAQKFLSSLFTGEVRQVTPTLGQFTSWCDGKGRMQVTFWLFMRGETYYLLMPLEMVPPTMTRLRQFLLRSKATITDVSTEVVRIGLSGPTMAEKLSAALVGAIPVARGETSELKGCTVVAIPGAGQSRWLALGEMEAVGALWDELKKECALIGASVWDLLDINAGIPFLQTATAGEFIPQMLDLEALGGLSFKKGCYPGQEVVARLQYRGQLKRRMYAATISTDVLPEAGAKLSAASTSESVGLVLASAKVGPGTVAALAVVVIEQKAAGDIHLGGLEGPKLVFAPGENLESA